MIDYKSLKEQFGTPLYVYDENKILDIMNAYKTNFKSDKFKTSVLYASKALSIVKLYKLCMETGLKADVVSLGEIYTALIAGMNPSDLYFHGNNKTEEEIEYALNNGVNHIVIDSYDDYILIEKIANRLNKEVHSLIRLNVGVEAHTHKFIVTAHVDSKFGVLIGSQELNNILSGIKNSKYVKLEGFHSHIGSQIFEMEGFYAAIDKLLTFIKTFNQKMSLNIGGGFGARYTDEDKPIETAKLCQMLINHTENKLKELNLEINELLMEPGRSIVCEAGTTLYTIGNKKETPNRKYYFIDGGMTDNIRPALYQAKYSADIVGKENEEKTETITVAGKCCESGDIIIEDILLQDAQRGDLMVVYSTGAYGYSMSSNYNKALKNAVVFVKDGKATLAVKRQTLKELLADEVL